MDANSFGAQSHSCEAINGARGFKGWIYSALILLQPALALVAVKQGQVSAVSVLARLPVV
jgi:hypothetical protein